MKKLFVASAILLAGITNLWAQAGQMPSGYVYGNPTALQGQPRPSSMTGMFDRAYGTTQGTFLTRGAALWAAVAMSGDCTLTSAGTITCTATNGVGFAASATADATNATNIASGTLAFARLPTIAADNLLGNATGGTAVLAAIPLLDCHSATNALTYNTGTHVFACNSIVGSGTVNTGTSGQLAWYPGSTNVVGGNVNISISGGVLTIGVASTTAGNLVFEGSSSGAVTVVPQAAAGTPTITLPTASGTFAVQGTAPVAVSATTGAISITGVAGQVLAGAGPAFTATPTLGAVGVASGQLKLAGTTSGVVTLTVNDAAGTYTAKLPNGPGTAGQFLSTDGGTPALLAWANPAGGGTVNSGTSGQCAYYSASAAAVSGNANCNLLAGLLTLGQAGSTIGQLALSGNTSGTATITAQAAAGTTTFTLPTTSGTLAASGTAPITVNATTGAVGLSTANGIDQNVLLGKVANYTIANTDCGKRIQAGAGSTGYFTLTLPVVAGFDAQCRISILNGDTVRAKKLSGFPSGAPTLLWPLQEIDVAIVNGAWAVIRDPGRWRITAATTIYFDNTGSDSANDCLASGAANACQTMQAAYNLAFSNFDLNGFTLTIQAASAETFTNYILSASNNMTGQIGPGNVVLDLANTGGSVFNQTNGTPIFNIYGSGITIRNMKCTASSITACIIAGQNSWVQIGANMNYGAVGASGNHLLAAHSGGNIQILNSYTISGGAGTHYSAQTGALIAADGSTTTTCTGAFAFSVYAQAFGTGKIYAGAQIFSGCGSVTGTRYSGTANAIINTGGGGANFFPGNVAGAVATGGVYQ